MTIHITKITGNAGSGKSTALRALATTENGTLAHMDYRVHFVNEPSLESIKREIANHQRVTVLVDECSPKFARKLAELEHPGTVHFYLAMPA